METRAEAWGMFIPVLVIIVVLAIVLTRRFRVGFFSGRRPQPRHVAVRIICGVLGVAILVAVAIGTILDVRSCYAPRTEQAMMLRVPTKPALLTGVPFKPGEYELTRKTRILVTFVATEPSTVVPHGIEAKTLEVAWPQDKGRTFNWAFKLDAIEISAAVCIQKVTAYRDSQDGPEKISRLDGSWEVTRRSLWGGGSSSGNGSWIAAWQMLSYPTSTSRYPTSRGWHSSCSLLSVAPTVSVDREPSLYAFFTPLAADDPLKEVTPAEFVASRRDDIARVGADGEVTHSAVTSGMDSSVPLRGLLLVSHIGVSSLLLLAAAILLSQIFTNRVPVFAVLLAGVILYVAALDRVGLGMHLSRLEDLKAPTAVRTVACAQATGTFFYGRTALEHLDAVAKDASTPKELKDLAGEAATMIWGRVKF